MNAERINKVLTTNVTGSFLCCKEAIIRMSTKNGGHGGVIVNVSSVASRIGSGGEYVDYAASKGAIEGLTRSLAAEFAPTIRFNAIAPSLTDTPLASKLLNKPEKKEANAQRHPLKKIGEAEDIAEMAVFLLSEKSRWMTGQILHVDGGMSSVKM